MDFGSNQTMTTKHTGAIFGGSLNREYLTSFMAMVHEDLHATSEDSDVESVRQLIQQRDALLAALRAIVTFETADANDDDFVAMAEDAAERGHVTTAQYRAELIEGARAAIAKVEGV